MRSTSSTVVHPSPVTLVSRPMPLSPTALEPLLRVAMVPGIGGGRLVALLRRFGSAERVMDPSEAEVAAMPGIGPKLAAEVRTAGTPEGAERALRARDTLDRAGAVAITPDDLAYPDSFRSLPDAQFL